MISAESLSSLVGAFIGALAAISATWWSMKRTTEDARAEERRAERTSLEALLLEMEVVGRIAGAGSLAGLPTQMLENSLSGIHHMENVDKAHLVDYTQAVYRYNGRAGRIVAFGAAKRATDQKPGPERVSDEHIAPVVQAIAAARHALEAQLATPRLRGSA